MTFSDFTNKEEYKKLLPFQENNTSIFYNLNGISIPVKNKELLSKVNTATLVSDSPKTINIDDYNPPSKVVMDTFNQIGLELDKTIESSFLLQSFRVRGSEIICTTFCFLISLLSCSDRNTLYNALKSVNDVAKSASVVMSSINNTIDTINATSIAMSDIFNDKNAKTSDILQNKQPQIATLLAMPMSIMKNIQVISKALGIAKNFRFSYPDPSGINIWNLSDNVLALLQTQVLQVADEMMNKFLSPVKSLIDGIQPAPCFGIFADRIRQTIHQVLNSLKGKILSEIADLFRANSSFNLQLRTINLRLAWSLELEAILKAFNFISANFFQVALSCGVSPCIDKKNSYINNIFQKDDIIGNVEGAATNSNPFRYQPSTLPVYANNVEPLNGETLDGLADKLSNFMNQNAVKIDDNNIRSVSNLFTVAPEQIKNLIKNNSLNNVLDNNYTILPDMTIVYNYNKNCSGE